MTERDRQLSQDIERSTTAKASFKRLNLVCALKLLCACLNVGRCLTRFAITLARDHRASDMKASISASAF